MSQKVLLVIIAALLCNLCQAVDLVFHQGAQCGPSLYWAGCIDLPMDTCCLIYSTWCGVMECIGCNRGNYLYTYIGEDSCEDEPHKRCVQPGADGPSLLCCLDFAGNELCGGSWASVAPGAVTDRVKPQNNCTKSAEPNKISYVDLDGVRRDIFLPKGSFPRATELVVAKDFVALAAEFPVW
ncbi:hypothetical protein B0T24DRAFT_704728, partial [Lasiosphaeria ovina]